MGDGNISSSRLAGGNPTPRQVFPRWQSAMHSAISESSTRAVLSLARDYARGALERRSPILASDSADDSAEGRDFGDERGERGP